VICRQGGSELLAADGALTHRSGHSAHVIRRGELAKKMPQARFVSPFNTVPSEVLSASTLPKRKARRFEIRAETWCTATTRKGESRCRADTAADRLRSGDAGRCASRDTRAVRACSSPSSRTRGRAARNWPIASSGLTDSGHASDGLNAKLGV